MGWGLRLDERATDQSVTYVYHIEIYEDALDPTTYSTTKYPTMDPIQYFVTLTNGSTTLRSPVFSTANDNFTTPWVWDNVIFPNPGTWTIRLFDTRNEGVPIWTSSFDIT